jgi:hypothetical protein
MSTRGMLRRVQALEDGSRADVIGRIEVVWLHGRDQVEVMAERFPPDGVPPVGVEAIIVSGGVVPPPVGAGPDPDVEDLDEPLKILEAAT